MTQEFYRHMPVYLPSGRRFGHVLEVGHAVDMLHIQQGVILIRDWYVPMSAVANVTDQGVYLLATQDELRRNGWNVPPEQYLQRQGSTPGYEYTSAADIPPYAPENTAGART